MESANFLDSGCWSGRFWVLRRHGARVVLHDWHMGQLGPFGKCVNMLRFASVPTSLPRSWAFFLLRRIAIGSVGCGGSGGFSIVRPGGGWDGAGAGSCDKGDGFSFVIDPGPFAASFRIKKYHCSQILSFRDNI